MKRKLLFTVLVTTLLAISGTWFAHSSYGASGQRVKSFWFDSTRNVIYFVSGNSQHKIKLDQSEFYGSALWPEIVSCNWSISNVGLTFEAFPADSDCTYPSGSGLVGAALAPTTKIPAIRFASLKKGRYNIRVTGMFKAEKASTSLPHCNFRIHDGTNLSELPSGGVAAYQDQGGSTTRQAFTGEINGTFIYTEAQGDTTFEIMVYSGNNSGCYIPTDTSNYKDDLAFYVERLPL